MLFHHEFIKMAKKYEKKLAIVDKTLNRLVSYKKALIGSLILAKKFKKYPEGFIGIMLPNTAGTVLSVLAALMSGRIPVMINYSTGAELNCKYAQKKCAFTTIITSQALCQKINCSHIDGMVYLEDIMKSITFFNKIRAAIKAGSSAENIINSVHHGSENDTLVILFTSGSEKDPKAVQLTHKNISSNYASLIKAFKFSSDDIFLANLPYFHSF